MYHKIRPMTEADRTCVRKMMREFYASPALLTNGSEEIFRADIAACTGPSPFAEGFILLHDGETAGYSMVAHSYSTEYGKPCVWIEDIYVLPAHRGCGLATLLIDRLKAAYPDAILRLEAEEENGRAIAVYKRNGFRRLPYYEMICP